MSVDECKRDCPFGDMPINEFHAFLDGVAERGANRALAKIGLQDEAAAKDVMELRGIVGAWREARCGFWEFGRKLVTMLILGWLVIRLGLSENFKALKFWTWWNTP